MDDLDRSWVPAPKIGTPNGPVPEGIRRSPTAFRLLEHCDDGRKVVRDCDVVAAGLWQRTNPQAEAGIWPSSHEGVIKWISGCGARSELSPMGGLIRSPPMNHALEIPRDVWSEQPGAAPGGILLAVLLSALFWAVCLRVVLAA